MPTGDDGINETPSPRSYSVGNQIAAAPPLQQLRPSVAPPPPQMCALKRPPAPLPEPVLNKKARADASPHVGWTVSVCNRAFTFSALSWYIDVANPPPKLCARIKQECCALELSGCDLRSLTLHGYAVPRGQIGKDLLPTRTRLSSKWTQTPLVSEKSTLEVREAGTALTVGRRQALFLVSDLEEVVADWKRRRRSILGCPVQRGAQQLFSQSQSVSAGSRLRCFTVAGMLTGFASSVFAHCTTMCLFDTA